MSVTPSRLGPPTNFAWKWLSHPRSQSIGVAVLLLVQACLLAYSATRHSPTHLEPAFLASGVSHWQHRRFELYRVNPPLVRLVAALPSVVLGCDTDWSRFHDCAGCRAEFAVGEDFIKVNGTSAIRHVIYARWACIPFNLMGAYFAYRWARELYGNAAGLACQICYIFEPNLLAHGELITPDGACTALGIVAGYCFWRWLKRPSWWRAFLCGGALGLAELSKMSWLILFGLWPLLWLFWRCTSDPGRKSAAPPLRQLIAILSLAVYAINCGYAFDGAGSRLGDYEFVSKSLTGLGEAGVPGNRFRATWVSSLPVPLPKQFVLGLDSQRKDFESFTDYSYLRGEWKKGGWWYYYIYGLLIKVPCGIWGVFILSLWLRIFQMNHGHLRDEVILLTPAIALLVLVSSQTEFNIHLRYVFPSLGLALIFLSQIFSSDDRKFDVWRGIATSLLVWSVASSLYVYPYHLAYFNDFIGGPQNGHHHLLGSSFDWGQELNALFEELQRHPEIVPKRILVKYPFSILPQGIAGDWPERLGKVHSAGERISTDYPMIIPRELTVDRPFTASYESIGVGTLPFSPDELKSLVAHSKKISPIPPLNTYVILE